MWLWAWGFAGAFVYAAPIFSMTLWADSRGDAETRRLSRLQGATSFGVSLITGGILAAGLTQVVIGAAAAGIAFQNFTLRLQLDPVSAALTIGLSCNFLWPKLLRRLGELADGPSKPKSNDP